MIDQLRPPRRADGATLVAIFLCALFIIPARLVLRGLPLSLTAADVVGLAIALCWLCAHFTNSLGMAKGPNAVRTGIFVYAIVMLIVYGYTTYAYLPSDELNLADHSAVLIVAHVGVALAMCDGVRGRERLEFVLKAVVVAGAILAVIGALQFLVDFDLTEYMVFPGLRYSSEEMFVLERSTLRRVGATTGHPIEFGVLCSMTLPIAAHFGFHARDRGQPAGRWWLCTGLIGAGLMFSVSRSAVLGMAGVGLVLLLGWPARRRLQALGAAVAFLIGMRLVAPGLLGTFYGLFSNLGSDDSIRYRTHDYDNAVLEISMHPWFGRGVGTWYAPKHQIFDNQYLLTLVEAGIVGLVAFVGIFLCVFYAAIRARYLSTDPVTRDLALTLGGCLVIPLIGAATFDLLSFTMVTGLTFLLVGAVGALLRIAREERHLQGSGPTVEVTR
ncbi:O-antigen ligase family protein [Streptosporangium sp. KLBMP 9127]|nr:O-antigen ligase family protein [Streptosporangium sp. KLBMP 9127]